MRRSNFNPFTPHYGYAPPLLAGREEETGTLTQMIKLLDGPRTWRERKLKSPPFSPITIFGPCGAGKTALLSWAEAQAQKRKIHTVRCSCLDDGGGTGEPMLQLLAAMDQASPKLRKRMWKPGKEMPVIRGGAYGPLVKRIVAKDPLLLLLDEVQHYNLRSLTQLLQTNQVIMSQDYPLGVVMAGTPDLKKHLGRTKASFIFHSCFIHADALSDEATQEALQIPFDDAKVKVAPDALQAMIAQTDNHPFFIQLIGAEVWKAMMKTGRKEVDAALVAQAESKARGRRIEIYAPAYRRIVKSGLVKQASKVMALFENNTGEVKEQRVIRALIEADHDTDERKAYEIRDRLCEHAFIWTIRGIAKPGIPSFFSYFKEKRRKLGQLCPLS